MTFQEIAHRKIAGVPVLYLAGAAVVILAVVAWRMKPSPDTTDGTPPDAAGDAQLDENGLADGSDPYAGFSTNGTVIVQPAPPAAQDTEDNRPGSNDEWVRQGAEWLVAEKKVNGQAAYVALEKYINGQSRSYQESGWVDMVIAEKGLPPESFIGTGPTAANPAPTTPSSPAANSMKIVNLKLYNARRDHVTVQWGVIGRPDKFRLFVNGARNREVAGGTHLSEVGPLAANHSYTIGVAPVKNNVQGPVAYMTAKTTK
jgi:hypothetical protein